METSRGCGRRAWDSRRSTPGRSPGCWRSSIVEREDLHDRRPAGVELALHHLALDLAAEVQRQSRKLSAQLLHRVEQLRILRATGAEPKLRGRVRLQYEHAARIQRGSDVAVN